MGGNYRTNSAEAERINITTQTRVSIANNIIDSLKNISDIFCSMFNEPMWSESLFLSKRIFSGSSAFLFSSNINSEEFSIVKPSVGDIDIQIDIKHSNKLEEFFEQVKDKYLQGEIRLIGWKPSVGQYVTLWYIGSLDKYVQIDFETVEFENGFPTEWAKFSRSSNWEDLQVEIKGVTHKWLIQSICALDNTSKVILTGKTKKPKEINKSAMTFSVTHGIRCRYIPVIHNGTQQVWKDEEWNVGATEWNGYQIFREIPTSESTFYTKPEDIFKKLFGHTPGLDELTDLYSFRGACNLIGRYFDDEQIFRIADDLANRMWGTEAQEIVRWDAERDFNEKLPALSWYCTRFCIDLHKYQPLAFQYYSSFGNRKV